MAWGHAISAAVRHQSMINHLQNNRMPEERNRLKLGATSYHSASSPTRAISAPLLSSLPHIQVLTPDSSNAHKTSIAQWIAAVFRPISETLRTLRQRLTLEQLTKKNTTLLTDSSDKLFNRLA